YPSRSPTVANPCAANRAAVAGPAPGRTLTCSAATSAPAAPAAIFAGVHPSPERAVDERTKFSPERIGGGLCPPETTRAEQDPGSALDSVSERGPWARPSEARGVVAGVVVSS